MKRLLAISILLVTGCAGRAIGDFPKPPVIQQTFAYREVESRIFIIWAVDTKTLAIAKKALGCGVCASRRAGEVEIVEVLAGPSTKEERLK